MQYFVHAYESSFGRWRVNSPALAASTMRQPTIWHGNVPGRGSKTICSIGRIYGCGRGARRGCRQPGRTTHRLYSARRHSTRRSRLITYGANRQLIGCKDPVTLWKGVVKRPSANANATQARFSRPEAIPVKHSSCPQSTRPEIKPQSWTSALQT